MELTKDQKTIYDFVESTNHIMLVTGKPGTGKSVLTRALRAKGQKNYTVSAPTGLAALNASGRTLHSIFRIPIADAILAPDYNEFVKDEGTLNFIRHGLKFLVIDEISMVRADTLDYIDRALREIKGVDKPFGGIQVIFIGDFFQLPPVVNRFHKKQLIDAGYKSEFAFDSLVWKQCSVSMYELTEVLRQKDDLEFMSILNSAREGSLTNAQLKVINKQVRPIYGMRIALTAINKDADYINSCNLKKIVGSSYTFRGIKYGEWPALPVQEKFEIKIGAQVMVKVNGADRPPKVEGTFVSKVVNGTLGKVIKVHNADSTKEAGNVEIELNNGDKVKIYREEDGTHDYVEIELSNGDKVKIYRKRWERKLRERGEDNRWQDRTVASYEQMPLSLAWAISMHKSQGQTFERVHIDATKIFAAGQLYVALSRCTSLAGISLETPISRKQFLVNMKVQRFYEDNINKLTNG